MEENKLATISNKIETVLMQGDLAPLNAEERVQYHNKVCESLGMNPLTKPFEYIKLNGKLQLYAKKDAADQLRRIYGISVKITKKEAFDGIYMVSAMATDKTGRTDEASGFVNIQGLKGQDLANAFMKCETKAKRRVTLSICGLGMLDETEVEDIPKGPRDVTPQQYFLPNEADKPKTDALIQAFMGLGVEADDILKLYDIADLSDLSNEQLEELRRMFKMLKSGEMIKEELFGGPDERDQE